MGRKEANERVDRERGKDARMRKGVLTTKNKSSRPVSWNSDALEVRTRPEHGEKDCRSEAGRLLGFLGKLSLGKGVGLP